MRVLIILRFNRLCYDNDAVELSAVQHIGHKLFHALFGIEKLPICVLCGEDEQQTDENIAIPGMIFKVFTVTSFINNIFLIII